MYLYPTHTSVLTQFTLQLGWFVHNIYKLCCAHCMCLVYVLLKSVEFINRAWRDDEAHSTVNTENSNLHVANFETVFCYFLLFCNHRNIKRANILLNNVLTFKLIYVSEKNSLEFMSQIISRPFYLKSFVLNGAYKMFIF